MPGEKQSPLLSLDELAKLPSTYAQPAWWKEATIFQIWPASFCDSNGDGIGDIGGILSKVDYLKELGADVVWTSPIYPSPNHDMGYDVADYKDIKKEYGTLEDVDRLIAELKKRDMKLVMDLVVNHTSNEHAWFKESSASPSKSNPKKDWYIWRPAKKGTNGERLPPNNWVSFFCGSAWTWCEARQEYYLSLFCPEQPDLNWENPDVREAVQDVMRFWLDRGVAGFRCDVINQISKTYEQDGSEYPPLPDAPVTNPDSLYQPATSLFCDGPRVHEFIREINDKVLSHYDTITVGESPFLDDPKKLLYWTHPERKELRMNFQFDIVTVDCDPMAPIKPRDWTLPELKLTTNKWQAFCHRHNGWNSNYSCNHDQCRPVSRWLSDAPSVRKQAAKTHALHQITLGGTLYVYQGEELGMKNIPEDWPIEEYQDIMTVNYYKECMDARAAGKKDAPDAKTVTKWASMKARDNGRTPVQWAPTAHGGFTSPDAQPWMRAQSEDAIAGWNAQDESGDPGSVLNFWREALRQRRAHRFPLVYGGFALLAPKHPHIFAYARYHTPGAHGPAHGGEGATPSLMLVVLNFSDSQQTFTIHADEARRALPDIDEDYRPLGPLPELGNLSKRAEKVLETTAGAFKGWDADASAGAAALTLPPYEGVLFSVAV